MRGDEWKARGLCRDVPSLPWIADAEHVPDGGVVAMSAVCAMCPVCFECLDYADCEGVVDGFWAGRFRGPSDAIGTGDAA
jgi:hypothetical protein